MRLFNRELIKSRLCICFPRSQNDRRELWLVWRVGKMLCFETVARSARISLSPFSFGRAIEQITGVELLSRFGGIDLHYAPACRFVNSCGKAELISVLIKYKIVIVSTSEFQL